MKLINRENGEELVEVGSHKDYASKGIAGAGLGLGIAESNRELETFKKFQIAAQANPNLTYKEFCENINNK